MELFPSLLKALHVACDILLKQLVEGGLLLVKGDICVLQHPAAALDAF